MKTHLVSEIREIVDDASSMERCIAIAHLKGDLTLEQAAFVCRTYEGRILQVIEDARRAAAMEHDNELAMKAIWANDGNVAAAGERKRGIA